MGEPHSQNNEISRPRKASIIDNRHGLDRSAENGPGARHRIRLAQTAVCCARM